MTIYIMDRDFQTLKESERIIQNFNSDIKCCCYTNSSQLLNAITDSSPDAIFLEKEERNSVSAVEKLRNEGNDVNIVMTTIDGELSPELSAYNLSGVLIKPLTEEKLEMQIKNLRHTDAKQNKFGGLFSKQTEKRKVNK